MVAQIRLASGERFARGQRSACKRGGVAAIYQVGLAHQVTQRWLLTTRLLAGFWVFGVSQHLQVEEAVLDAARLDFGHGQLGVEKRACIAQGFSGDLTEIHPTAGY